MESMTLEDNIVNHLNATDEEPNDYDSKAATLCMSNNGNRKSKSDKDVKAVSSKFDETELQYDSNLIESNNTQGSKQKTGYSNSRRCTQFNILKVFEFRRNPTFETHLLNMNVFINSLSTFLLKRNDEIKSIERVVLAYIQSNRIRACRYKAIQNLCDRDIANKISAQNKYATLDHNGDIVFKKSGVQKEELNYQASSTSVSNLEEQVEMNGVRGSMRASQISFDEFEEEPCMETILTTSIGTDSDICNKSYSEKILGNSNIIGLDGFLSHMERHHDLKAAIYNESADYLERETLVKIREVDENFKNLRDRVKIGGNNILFELEMGEQIVEETWDMYSKCPQLSSGKSSRNISTTSGAISSLNEQSDIWLLETRYRISVSQLNIYWEKCVGLLKSLYTLTEKFEKERRIVLNQLLRTLAEQGIKHASLFDEKCVSTDGNSDLLTSLNQMPTNTQEVADDVRTFINEIAKDIRHRTVYYKCDMQSEYSINDLKVEFGSVLLSESLVSSKVLRRRCTKGLTGKCWVVTLCFVTIDGFLHCFDLPYDSFQEHTAEEAFMDLIVGVETPSIDTENKHGRCKWHSLITPTKSTQLEYSTVEVKYDNKENDYIAEITEVIPLSAAETTGLNFWRKDYRQTIYIRDQDEDNLRQWVSQLGQKVDKS